MPLLRWKQRERERDVPAPAPAMTAAPQESRITFRTLMRDAVTVVTGVEAKWLGTARGMITNAGRTVLEYVGGLRTRYAHPVAWAAGCISALVLTKQLLVRSGSLSALFDPVLLLGAIWPYLSFVVLVPAAFIARALFRRKDLLASEWYVLLLYLAGQVALFETGIVIIDRLLPLPELVVNVLRMIEAVYCTAAVVQFARELRWTGWLRAAGVVASTVALFYGVMIGIVWLIIRSLFG